MKTFTIIAWIIMAVALIFYVVVRYIVKKKQESVLSSDDVINSISLDEIQKLLNDTEVGD